MRPTTAIADCTYRTLGHSIFGRKFLELLSVGSALSNFVHICLRKLCHGMAFTRHLMLEKIAILASANPIRIFPSPVVVTGIGDKPETSGMGKVSLLIAPFEIFNSIVGLAAIQVVDIWKPKRVFYENHRNQPMDKQALGPTILGRQCNLLVAIPRSCANCNFPRRKSHISIARNADRWESFSGDVDPCIHHSSVTHVKEN
jgi:hypothetical protein